MKKLIFLSSIIILILTITHITLIISYIQTMVFVDEIKPIIEQAYFEGQRDVLSGDVRIKKNI